LEQEGSRFTLKSTKDHCYHDVAIELSPYSATAMGKDGHDCTDDERFQMVGFKRPDGSNVWIVTFDSVYGSNIAAYTLKDGKLRQDKTLSDAMPSAATLIPAELQSDDPAAQKTMTSIEPHFYLDDKGLRAQVDAKQVAKLCTIAQQTKGCATPRVVVLKWNKKTGAFEADAAATASALTAAIAEAKAQEEANAAAAPKEEEEAVAEEGAGRKPLRHKVRRQ
jgi:hypothetical protein